MYFLKICVLALSYFLVLASGVRSQDYPFYFGADLSYVNQMEDCGAVYRYKGEPRDPFSIFAEQGNNLVRARLWVDPSWWQEPLDQPDGVKPWYNDLEDVIKTFRRAQNEGMETMLGLHYSDFWADPGRQLIPRAWVEVADNTEALRDSVYQYTHNVLTRLEEEGLMPDLVKVGNETNPGMLVHIPEEKPGFGIQRTVSSSDNFERHAMLFNAGIQAIRQVGQIASKKPKISLHYSGFGANWWYGEMMDAGVTDFDIIGFTYYYAWHGGSIDRLENTVETLVTNYQDYDVMVVETGYLWSQDYGGIINDADPDYLPVIPEKQLEYMVDYTRAVMRSGGVGVIFWEPAWVDTPCVTPWGTGSSHTHVAFFHPDDLNFMENGGGRWTNPEFYKDPQWPKVTFKVDMRVQEVADEGVYITGSFTGEDGDRELLPMADEGDNIFSYFTYLPEGETGAYYFVNGDDSEARETVPEACADQEGTDREYAVPGSDTVFDFGWESCDPITEPDDVRVTFMVDMVGSGVDYSDGVYITGTFTRDNGDWNIVSMSDDGNGVFSHEVMMTPGEEGAYYYLTTGTWSNYQDYREDVPEACAAWYGSDRGYVIPDHDVTFAFKWGTCEAFELSTIIDKPVDNPDDMTLKQNFPNPFNPVTEISYVLSEAKQVSLHVYDMMGQRVAILVDEFQSAGRHHVSFEGSHLSSGIYIYVLKGDRTNHIRKMTLIK